MEGSLTTLLPPGLENAVLLERQRQRMAIIIALSQAWARSQADLEQATS